MKKGVFLAVMILGIMSVSSLKAQLSIGPGVHYATEIESIGIQGVAAYELPSNLGVMAGYTHFLEKDNVKWSAIDVDATYSLYSMEERGSVYALAGVSFLQTKVEIEGVKVTGNDTGFNIGAGWKIGMGSTMNLVPEVRYTFVGDGFLRVGVKLMFGLMNN